jgi:hypothetical protein
MNGYMNELMDGIDEWMSESYAGKLKLYLSLLVTRIIRQAAFDDAIADPVTGDGDRRCRWDVQR